MTVHHRACLTSNLIWSNKFSCNQRHTPKALERVFSRCQEASSIFTADPHPYIRIWHIWPLRLPRSKRNVNSCKNTALICLQGVLCDAHGRSQCLHSPQPSVRVLRLVALLTFGSLERVHAAGLAITQLGDVEHYPERGDGGASGERLQEGALPHLQYPCIYTDVWVRSQASPHLDIAIAKTRQPTNATFWSDLASVCREACCIVFVVDLALVVAGRGHHPCWFPPRPLGCRSPKGPPSGRPSPGNHFCRRRGRGMPQAGCGSRPAQGALAPQPGIWVPPASRHATDKS